MLGIVIRIGVLAIDLSDENAELIDTEAGSVRIDIGAAAAAGGAGTT